MMGGESWHGNCAGGPHARGGFRHRFPLLVPTAGFLPVVMIQKLNAMVERNYWENEQGPRDRESRQAGKGKAGCGTYVVGRILVCPCCDERLNHQGMPFPSCQVQGCRFELPDGDVRKWDVTQQIDETN